MINSQISIEKCPELKEINITKTKSGEVKINKEMLIFFSELEKKVKCWKDDSNCNDIIRLGKKVVEKLTNE